MHSLDKVGEEMRRFGDCDEIAFHFSRQYFRMRATMLRQCLRTHAYACLEQCIGVEYSLMQSLDISHAALNFFKAPQRGISNRWHDVHCWEDETSKARRPSPDCLFSYWCASS